MKQLTCSGEISSFQIKVFLLNLTSNVASGVNLASNDLFKVESYCVSSAEEHGYFMSLCA